jgi:uncharacterized protein (DUF362 family)
MSHHSNASRPLSRRRFLRLASAGLLAGLGGLHLAAPRAANAAAHRQATTRSHRVLLHTFDPALTTPTDAVRAAVLSVTDFSWLRQGDSVFVKLASNSGYAPPSVTSPDVLAGVVGLVREAGAGTVYVGDMSGAIYVRHLADRTIGSTREIMRTNGLLAAAEAAGATVHCFEEVPFARAYIPGVPTGNSTWEDDLQVAAILDEVDHVVNLPRLGKHVLAGASLGLKNAVGWISDYSRMVLHRDGDLFHTRIAEINTIPQLAEKMRFTLTLVDRALTTYGPDSGHALTLARPLIVAAEDVACHDQIALLALLWGRTQTPPTALAQDPYPAQSNGLNWWFVRVTWDTEGVTGYTDLPTFDDLTDATIPTQFNTAFDLLWGARPETIEVIPGGMAPDADLLALLSADPALGITVGNAG